MSAEDFKDVEKAMEAPQEQFIETTEVEQVLDDDDDDVDRMQEDGDEDVGNADENGEQGEGQNEDYEEQLEIDMSNNSVTYFDQHGDSVFTVARHPSLPLVISGGGDNIAHLWTTHSTPPRHVCKIEHTESVISGGFTADGKYLVTADMNGQVLVHKSTKGGAKWIKVCEAQEVEEVVWLKVHEQQNGYFAFGGVDGSVWCYQIDEATDSLVHLMSGYQHAQDCTMGQFLDVGSEVLTLVTCSLDGTIVGWNCFTGQAQFKVTSTELKGLEAPWVTLAAAPSQMTKDTPIVACGSSNGTLAVINASKGTVLFLETVLELQEGQEELDLSIEAISWSAQRNLMVLGMVSGVVVLYDTLTWRKRHRFDLPDSVTRLQFDRTQGDLLFASCIDGKVYIFNARTGEQVHVCVGHNMGVLDFTLFEEHRRLVTAGDEGVSLVFEYP